MGKLQSYLPYFYIKFDTNFQIIELANLMNDL
jgi:hypothetical protein